MARMLAPLARSIAFPHAHEMKYSAPMAAWMRAPDGMVAYLLHSETSADQEAWIPRHPQQPPHLSGRRRQLARSGVDSHDARQAGARANAASLSCIDPKRASMPS